MLFPLYVRVGVWVWFCDTVLYVLYSFGSISPTKRELGALLCILLVCLFLTVPWVGLWSVIVAFASYPLFLLVACWVIMHVLVVCLFFSSKTVTINCMNFTANTDGDAYKSLWKFLLNLLSNYELTIHIHWRIIKLTGKPRKDFNICFFNLSQGVDMTMKFG